MNDTTSVTCAAALAIVCVGCAHASSAPPPSRGSVAPAPVDVAARAIDTELARLAADPAARVALAVVLDPRTGRVLAMSGRRAGAVEPELPAAQLYCPGSIMKAFSIATALERGAVGLEDVFIGGAEYDLHGMHIRDAAPHDDMRLGDVVAYSSNIGAAQVFERLGRGPLLDGLARFHLAHRAPSGIAEDDDIAVRVAIGSGIELTPLEIAAAFAVIANGGTYYAPWREGESAPRGEPVLSEATARTLRELFEGAVQRDDATGTGARIAGVRVMGKTGTASRDDGASYADFVGAVPAGDPRFVILVGVETTAEGYTGGTVAAPAFARIATTLLAGL